jgi:RPA family protein
MIAFGKRCSDEINIPLVIGVVSNERTKAKMDLYRRQLGEPCGGYFVYSKRPFLKSAAIAEPAVAG